MKDDVIQRMTEAYTEKGNSAQMLPIAAYRTISDYCTSGALPLSNSLYSLAIGDRWQAR